MTSGSGSKRGHLFSPSHQCLDICTRVRCCGETSSTGPFSLFHFLYMYRHRYQPQDPTQHPQRSRSREKLSALASGFSGLQPSCPKSPESSPESKDEAFTPPEVLEEAALAPLSLLCPLLSRPLFRPQSLRPQHFNRKRTSLRWPYDSGRPPHPRSIIHYL